MTVTPEELTRVRLYINDPAGATQFLDDDVLEGFITESAGDLNRAASELWKLKAARVSEWYLVNIDGAFMSRDQAFDHALKMSTFYASGGGMTNVELTTQPTLVNRSIEF